MIFETNSPIPADDFRPAELLVLDSSDRQTIVAFASDPELAAFLERLGRYGEGVRPGRQTASLEGFFDSIDGVRRYGADDRITARLRASLDELAAEDSIVVDIECWYPDSQLVAEQWIGEVGQAAAAAGAEVIDRYLNAPAGVAMVRVRGQKPAIRQLAELDVVAFMDALPEPLIWAHEAVTISVENLPEVLPAAADAPLVAIIDSGVRSAHPLLAGCVHDAIALAGLGDGQDRHGHGTAVASLALHGSLEELLANGTVTRPLCRVLSIRVLDANNGFPGGTIWPKELEEAVRYAAQEGARVVNLSVGDSGTPFRGPRSTPVAAVLDQLIRELGLVLVVAAGNVHPAQYSARYPDIVHDYPRGILDDADCGILDPAPAALALTVGATVNTITPRQLGLTALGQRGWPSPFSRRGPGIGSSIKPELVAPGGSFAADPAQVLIDDPELACFVADGSGQAGSIVSTDIGTSFAAPVVSRIAAAVTSRYPTFSPSLVRALVLASVGETVPFLAPIDGVGETKLRSQARRLVGYGEPRLPEAIRSAPNRPVLIAEDEIAVDGVHIYEIPIPSRFFEPRTKGGLCVSLCYDADTRARRLDYLSSRMKFEIVRGVDAALVERLFLESPDDTGLVEQDAEAEEKVNETAGDVSAPSKLTDLSSVQRPTLEPSMTERSVGANQVGRRVFGRVLRKEDGTSFLLVVQNTNRWAPAGSRQAYALAVALWHEDSEAELYAELEAELQARIEVEIELRP